MLATRQIYRFFRVFCSNFQANVKKPQTLEFTAFSLF
nr:MAG TPA: hypothetical protein [Caudoviricetes sp.]